VGDGYCFLASLRSATVERIRLADGSVEAAVEEVRGLARERGFGYATWWVGERSTPAGLAAQLGALGLEPGPGRPGEGSVAGGACRVSPSAPGGCRRRSSSTSVSSRSVAFACCATACRIRADGHGRGELAARAADRRGCEALRPLLVVGAGRDHPDRGRRRRG